MSTDHHERPGARGHLDAELAQMRRALGLAEDVSEGEPQPEDRRQVSRPPVHKLPPGTAIGRLVVLDHLGGGGQGDVYTVYDPQLDRRVALKLIRSNPEHRDDIQNTRLMREAQALARLEHPNVVRVHDAGTHGGSAFLVMELKRSQSLARWLVDGKRSWREILDKFLAAGRGLRAAHDKEIVHRDVKADNIFVDDHVGAVLGDFGLAYGNDDGAALVDSTRTLSEPSRSLLATPLTQNGQHPGTEGYIAPEAMHGRATKKSDQYSFCVALFHALFCVLPQPDERRVPTRPGDNTPQALVRALQRGLARDPAARFPGMAELLDALDARPRRRITTVVAASALAASALVARIVTAQSEDPCVVATRALADQIWNADRRAALADAFLAVQLPFTYQTSESFLRLADAYHGRWIEARTAMCRAPDPAVDTCLSHQLDRFDRLLTMYATPDRTLVVGALDVAARLVDPSACRDPATNGWRDVPDDLRRELDRVELKIAGGDFASARADLAGLKLAVDHPVARARARYLAGWLAAASAPDRGSDSALEDAMHDAALARDPDTFTRAATYRLKSLVTDLGKPGEAERLERWIESIAVQWPDKSAAISRFRADFAEARAIRLDAQGDHAAAVEQNRKALDLRRELLGRDHPLVAKSHHNLAVSLAYAEQRDAAREEYAQAVRIRSEQFGETHPQTLESTFGMAQNECEQLAQYAEHDPGVMTDCVRDLEAALRAYKAHETGDRRGIVRRSVTFANHALDSGCDDCAAHALKDAEDILADQRDVDPRERSDLLAVRGKLAFSRGALPDARAAFIDGLDLWGPDGRRDEPYFQHLANAATVAVAEGLVEEAVDLVTSRGALTASCSERRLGAGVLDGLADALADRPSRHVDELRRAAASARDCANTLPNPATPL
jgi:tRNA A-37 threonylcarbamoyl transferase component Bud32/tetratricopeptide (TPR) repeat protein